MTRSARPTINAFKIRIGIQELPQKKTCLLSLCGVQKFLGPSLIEVLGYVASLSYEMSAAVHVAPSLSDAGIKRSRPRQE